MDTISGAAHAGVPGLVDSAALAPRGGADPGYHYPTDVPERGLDRISVKPPKMSLQDLYATRVLTAAVSVASPALASAKNMPVFGSVYSSLSIPA